MRRRSEKKQEEGSLGGSQKSNFMSTTIVTSNKGTRGGGSYPNSFVRHPLTQTGEKAEEEREAERGGSHLLVSLLLSTILRDTSPHLSYLSLVLALAAGDEVLGKENDLALLEQNDMKMPATPRRFRLEISNNDRNGRAARRSGGAHKA